MDLTEITENDARACWLRYWGGFDAERWFGVRGDGAKGSPGWVKEPMHDALRYYWFNEAARQRDAARGDSVGDDAVDEISRLRELGETSGTVGEPPCGGSTLVVSEGGKYVPNQTDVSELRPRLSSEIDSPEGVTAVSLMHWEHSHVREGNTFRLLQWLASFCTVRGREPEVRKRASTKDSA